MPLCRPYDLRMPGSALIAAGYVCALTSLLFVPPAFALGAFLIGTVNLAQDRIGHGIAQMVLSVVCGIAGVITGIGWILQANG